MRKHVILFVAANPRTSDPLRLAEECAEIQRELKMAPHRDDFQFESRWAVSIDELGSTVRWATGARSAMRSTRRSPPSPLSRCPTRCCRAA